MAHDAAADTIQSIKDTLSPYIKPREQTAYVRRVLALHLASHLPQDALPNLPPVVAGPPPDPTSYRSVPPSLQRDFLEALAANAAARAQLEDAEQQLAAAAAAAGDDGCGGDLDAAIRRREEKRTAGMDLLRRHAAGIEARKKKERLEVLQKHINSLATMPAASLDFLDAKEVFAHCPPLPPLPAEVAESSPADSGGATSKGDLKALAGRLERVALRAKLQFEKEDALLQDVKSRTSGVVGRAGPEAKLRALNATRDELITWIEGELGKTSEDGTAEAGREGDSATTRIQAHEETKARVAEQLAGVKELYAEYVEARKVLISSTTSRPQVPEITTTTQQTTPAAVPLVSRGEQAPGPPLHYLVPLAETLVALSAEHKDIIAHKTYIHDMFEKQRRETSQTLDTLASESQLLAKLSASRGPSALGNYGPGVRGGGGGGGGGDDDGDGAPSLTNLVRPWVTAADDAKLATLETVAEKIEDGEVALKECFEAVGRINTIIGRDSSGEEGGEEGGTGRGATQSMQTPRRRDLWSQLRGEVGSPGELE